MMFCLKLGIFLVQKALIYYTFNKSHLNSFDLLVIPHVANFRYVANFRFLTLIIFHVPLLVIKFMHIKVNSPVTSHNPSNYFHQEIKCKQKVAEEWML